MKYAFHIGIDISKKTLDFTVLRKGEWLLHSTLENSAVAIRKWLKEVMTLYRAGGKRSIFCMEHTGPYTDILLDVLTKRKSHIWLESSLQIKRSLGIQRGKNDKIDSRRIAEYANSFEKKIKLWQPPRKELVELRMLRVMRQRLKFALLEMQAPWKEIALPSQRKIAQSIYQNCTVSLSALSDDFKKTDLKIMDVIKSDQHLYSLFKAVTSVVGIGKTIAVELLIVTNEFKSFTSAKKFACYCAIAPFEYTSGTSVRTKAKVSKIGDRDMKSLLHLASLAAIKQEGEIRDYYKRKILTGKSKMSVINAVRNKIIHRVFACVQQNTLYDRKGKPSQREASELIYDAKN